VFPNCRKVGDLRLPSKVQKPEVLQLQKGFAPSTPDQRLCPWTPLWVLPPDLRYRFALPRSPWGCAPRCCGLKPPLTVDLDHRVIQRIDESLPALLRKSGKLTCSEKVNWTLPYWLALATLHAISDPYLQAGFLLVTETRHQQRTTYVCARREPRHLPTCFRWACYSHSWGAVETRINQFSANYCQLYFFGKSVIIWPHYDKNAT